MATHEDPDSIHIGAWLPADWRRPLDADEKRRVQDSDIDILLIPENHDTWANRGVWKRVAEEVETAIYAGFQDNGWTLGLFYDPASSRERVYTKHSTSEHIAPDRADWAPNSYLHTIDLSNVSLGTTICHDHYLSPFMRYERSRGADVLLNLSASPVVRRKWGEVLQARAIENAAYVVCTMHGRESDGSDPVTNKGHVFAFDPFGDQIELTDLETGQQTSPFDTVSDSIYTFEAERSFVLEARRTLADSDRTRPIDRIRQNEFGSPKPTETTLDVLVDDETLQLHYSDEERTLAIGESAVVRLGDETFHIVAIDATELFRPELLYRELLAEPDIEAQRLLLTNHWGDLPEGYLDNVVEPVVRARCVEWCSPALVTAGEQARGYQLANKHKDTHEIPTDDAGQFNFEVKRAFGVKSSLKPVDGRGNPLQTIAEECLTAASDLH